MTVAAELRPVSHLPAKLLPPRIVGSCPEFELLLACCSALPDGIRTDRIRQILLLPFDWNRLLHLGEHHRVIPHIYRELRGLALHDELDVLRRAYEGNVRKSLRLTGELIRILGHLESCGVETLPYKGPVLAEVLYGDVAHRQYADLDILVCAGQVPTAKAALAELGYRPHVELSEREEQAYLVSGYEYSFDGTLGSNLLEVQWQITPRFYSVEFDVAGFFERSVEVRLAGHAFRTLCTEDLFLVLCVHAAKHAWGQISLLCDIGQFVNGQSLDWDAVAREASRLGITRIVGISLLLTQRLLGAPMPAAVQPVPANDKRAECLADEIRSAILGSQDCNPESLAYFRLMTRVRERLQDRARFLWRLLTTPSVGEWSTVKLPNGVFGLHRIVRLFRLAKRAASA
jgi:hypothetical protein